MAADRRALWLGGILIVVVALMAAQSMSNSPPPTSATAPRAPAVRPGAREEGTAPVTVNLQALSRERGEPMDRGRNPIRFRPKAAPPPVFTPPPRASGNESPFGIPVMPTKPAGPPEPPPIPLKFIGIVGKLQDGKVTQYAVLSDGRNTDSGAEGKIVFGQYQILKIGNESIEMAYADGRGRRTIRLTGQ